MISSDLIVDRSYCIEMFTYRTVGHLFLMMSITVI